MRTEELNTWNKEQLIQHIINKEDEIDQYRRELDHAHFNNKALQEKIEEVTDILHHWIHGDNMKSESIRFIRELTDIEEQKRHKREDRNKRKNESLK